ncbi:MAG TPA: DUF167 domain-containing protein [Candidatus Nanoarchaeia archaeon]|nr:DUF167 domain-containing protein [Candidatus Nanoarchaeia archaeon]
MSLPFLNNKLSVRVIPNAAKTEIVSIENNIVKVRIAAPPDKNKANVELLKFFKKEFDLKLKINSGATSRKKVLEINS